MSDLTRSAFTADIEVRSDGRTIAGIAVPFDQETDIGNYREVFRRGAFRRTLEERGAAKVKLLALHDHRALPLGRLSSAYEDAAGLFIEARISQTTAGDEALQLIRDGALDSFSIGFIPIPSKDRWSQTRNLVERLEVKLHEISVVPFPAYPGAAITAIRQDTPYDPAYDPEFVRRRARLAAVSHRLVIPS